MDELNDQRQQRIKKLDRLRALGVAPYGTKFAWKDRAGVLIRQHGSKPKEQLEQEQVACTLAGRIVGLRRFGKAAFAVLQDGADRLQVYLKKDLLGEQGSRISEELDLGDWIGVEGVLFRTKTNEFTVEVRQLTFLSKALRPLPEKWHGLTDVETRYRQRYVDLIANPDVHAIFVTRSRIIGAIRNFLVGKGFLEVETPMMQPIPGGAAARPFVTHHNALGVDLYLRIAPELYLKRLIVGGFPRVFEINRNFRNEGISTIHNPEFTMLEFYVAYADYQDLILLTEELFAYLASEVLGTTEIEYQGHKINLAGPWRRWSYHQAVLEVNHLPPESIATEQTARDTAQRLGLSVDPKATLPFIVNEIFEETVEPKLIQPTFITDYPIELSPLARRKDHDPSLTDRFELYIAGREIANAFSELNDPLDQRQRFEQQTAQRDAGDEEAHYLDEDFLRALEYAMPPTAGEGIGIDRLVMLLTNQASIRDVILFPQLRPEKPEK
ncbi:lysine--tRNA ligase/Ap4A synthetase/Ap3A synthetase [Nitrospira tepida]|uniref:Lysine--tRNA ligase n=1 Tax=Nitrospira tepida TaxID=2973512 RepID=A0AA86TC87_9BACT|nr:lysine--tRNA ligase [Nitrospira tepida]CAI4031954.1 lysine--tRNA ligase/Ap4A synthetase/Ap3A synthetase [Nitrospira tepida]